MDQALNLPRLYAIADTATLHSRGLALIAIVEQWLEAGVRLIQLRHKGQYTRELYQTAAALCEKCRQRGALFVIDDRADIAALLGAGLHVGQDDLSPADARRVGRAAVLGHHVACRGAGSGRIGARARRICEMPPRERDPGTRPRGVSRSEA